MSSIWFSQWKNEIIFNFEIYQKKIIVKVTVKTSREPLREGQSIFRRDSKVTLQVMNSFAKMKMFTEPRAISEHIL